MELKSGSIVYHGTAFEHLSSIVDNGIGAVQGAWGDGELGAGFYTATTLTGGAAYLAGAGGVLEITTAADMQGYAVIPPPQFDWSGRAHEIEMLCTNYDFLVNQHDDPVSQYKFNNGRGTGKLTPSGVYLRDGQSWKRYAIAEYQALFN